MLEGLTETDALVPSEWLQLYVVPPDALRVVLLPLQMLVEVAEAVTFGAALTVKVADKVNGQPRTVNV